MQALQNDAVDVEIQDHIDARNLTFTLLPSVQTYSCEDHFGEVAEGCAHMMYLHRTRSLRVRAPAPPTPPKPHLPAFTLQFVAMTDFMYRNVYMLSLIHI